MGSRLEQNNAYIAGFLDGDGSLMLQVKSRADTARGVRFMATICLYQDSRHSEPLVWMQEVLGCGYLSKRKDTMTELRINGFTQVKQVLIALRPYIRFKVKQTDALITACAMLEKTTLRDMPESTLRTLVDLLFVIKQENYKSANALTKDIVLQRLGLTP